MPDEFPEAHSTINDLRLEYVIAVEGVVRPRPSDSVNQKMKTGLIEVNILSRRRKKRCLYHMFIIGTKMITLSSLGTKIEHYQVFSDYKRSL